MNVNHYIGFDVHKKSISYCVKAADGTILFVAGVRPSEVGRPQDGTQHWLAVRVV